MRVSVVPGKLMLLIGKVTLKVLEARFDLKNNSCIFLGAGYFQGKVLRVLLRLFVGPILSFTAAVLVYAFFLAPNARPVPPLALLTLKGTFRRPVPVMSSCYG